MNSNFNNPGNILTGIILGSSEVRNPPIIKVERPTQNLSNWILVIENKRVL